jgi:hypothetical protein
VQQQDVARREAAGEAAQHVLRIAPPRVVGAPRPGHQAQALPDQDGVEQRGPQAHRSAEPARRCPGDAGDDILRDADLPPQRPQPSRGETGGMGLRVVLHRVAARHDLAQQRWVALGAGADDEEAGAGAGRIEQVQHARRHLGVRAVVEGQRHGGGGGFGQARQVRAEQRGARVHRGCQQRMVAGQQPEHLRSQPRLHRRRRGADPVQPQRGARQRRGPPGKQARRHRGARGGTHAVFSCSADTRRVI